MNRFTRAMCMAAAAAALSALGSGAKAQSLPNGDLVIVNTSNTPADATTGNGHYESVELQAYNVSGATPVLDATIPLPGVTMMTNIDDDRHLELSVNGQMVTLAGYNAAQAPAGTVAPGAVGDDSLYSAPAASVNRMVVSVNLNGQASYINLNQNSSGAITNSAGAALYDTSEITSAITVDGSQYYISGEPQNANDNSTYAGAGPQYVSVSGGQVTAAYPLYDPDAESEGSASARSMQIFNGQLYSTTGSSSFGTHGTFALGTGLTVPTGTLGLAANLLSGQSGQSVNEASFQNEGGEEVAYYAAKNGIAKYINTSGANSNSGWVADGLIADVDADNEMNEITTQELPGGAINVFAVDGSGNLFKITDSSPLTDSLSGSLLSASSGTVYQPYIAASANDGGNMFFGGVAVVPEPGTLSLLAIGTGAALIRRRARKA